MRSSTIKIMVSAVAMFLMASAAMSQDNESRSYLDIQPRELIDAPTAWTLPRGCFDFVLRVYPKGGLLASTGIGLAGRFMIGISYGADRMISEEDASENPRLEFNTKLRLVDEQYYLPAIAIGFSSQGQESFNRDLDRYTYKSKGFYGVVTRSLYLYQWSVGGHAGINYSLEDDDGDGGMNLFFGIDTRFNQDFGLVMEYDMGLNDNNSSQQFGRGRGYLNMGLKWIYSENLEIEAVFKNLLNNRRGVNTFGRGLRLTYSEFL